MNPNQPKHFKHGPEYKIEKAVMAYMRERGWAVLKMSGNKYQQGIPDLYATHSAFGARWIEIKLPGMKGSRFTKAQREIFPLLQSHGSKIWIITAATHYEYSKLFQASNLWKYLVLKG